MYKFDEKVEQEQNQRFLEKYGFTLEEFLETILQRREGSDPIKKFCP